MDGHQLQYLEQYIKENIQDFLNVLHNTLMKSVNLNLFNGKLKRTGKTKKKCLLAVVLFYKEMSDNSIINYIQSVKTILLHQMISNVASLKKCFLYGTCTPIL